MHILFILLPLYILRIDLSIIFVAVVAGVFVDLDHLLIAPIKKWRMHLDFDIPRKVPLHNFAMLLISFLLSFLIIFNEIIGAVFAGIFLHLLWDLTEDIIVFRFSLQHWKI
jgi:hypothetical protein